MNYPPSTKNALENFTGELDTKKIAQSSFAFGNVSNSTTTLLPQIETSAV